MKTKKSPTYAEYADFAMDEALLAHDKSTSYQAIANHKDSKKQPMRDRSKWKETKSSVTHITQTANNPNQTEKHCQS